MNAALHAPAEDHFYDTVVTVRGDGTYTTSTSYIYNAESSPGSGIYTGAYQGGAVTYPQLSVLPVARARLAAD